jgi:dimeric dUTPase (all-alpha-NTP-PPase superfamily)
VEKMDKLDEIFYMQEKFDTDLAINRGLTDIPADKWIQMQTLAMISELAELLDEVNFKWWKNPKELNPTNIKEELVDILHFFTGMCIRAGMTSKELYQIYMKKNKENFDRQYGKSDKKGYEIGDK